MAAMNIVRIIVQIFAVIINLIGIGLISAGILSSGWQIMIESGTGEIHQHGLWIDYIYTTRFHMAGAPAAHLDYFNTPLSGADGSAYGYGTGTGFYNLAPGGQWIMTYKFGSAVYGNDSHRAQPYQVYALILLSLTIVFSVIGLMLSYYSGLKPGFAIGWAALLLFGVILGAAGLIQFYISCMLPEYRFVFTDREIQLFVGYSYWWAVAGTIAVGFGMIASVAVGVLQFFAERNRNNGERITVVKEPGVWRTGINPVKEPAVWRTGISPTSIQPVYIPEKGIEPPAYGKRAESPVYKKGRAESPV